jgi:uncharacterized protein YjbJ (UPF0337 family)
MQLPLKEHPMRPTQIKLLIGSLLLGAAPAIAQTATPAAQAASSSDGMGWLWIVLLLVAAGAAVWYFFFRNKSSTMSSAGVDRDRLAGSAEQAKGSIKDTVGSVLGDTKLQAEGKLDKAEGRAQNTAGGIKGTLRGK